LSQQQPNSNHTEMKKFFLKLYDKFIMGVLLSFFLLTACEDPEPQPEYGVVPLYGVIPANTIQMPAQTPDSTEVNS